MQDRVRRKIRVKVWVRAGVRARVRVRVRVRIRVGVRVGICLGGCSKTRERGRGGGVKGCARERLKIYRKDAAPPSSCRSLGPRKESDLTLKMGYNASIRTSISSGAPSDDGCMGANLSGGILAVLTRCLGWEGDGE